MKRLEHSEIIEACKSAIQALVDEHGAFIKAEVVDRVLAENPEVDRTRVEHAAANCIQALDRWPTIEQLEIMSAEVTRHADVLITSGHLEEGIAYRWKYQAEVEQMIKAMAVDAYAMKIDAEVLGRSGDRCTHDLVKRIGGDAYIEAVKDELRRDGQVDLDNVIIPDADNLSVSIEKFLHWFQVEARRILNDEKGKITFYFPTGPEEAA